MFIVYFGTEKHSAWSTMSEAKHQANVLRDHGYKNVWVEEMFGLSVDNGHYYV